MRELLIVCGPLVLLLFLVVGVTIGFAVAFMAISFALIGTVLIGAWMLYAIENLL